MIEDLNQQTFVDIFSNPGDQNDPEKKGGFGANFLDTNILSTTETTTVSSTTETTTEASTTETTTINPDILGDSQNSDDQKGGKKDKDKGSLDLSSYFESRVKAGKFVALEEETEDGEKIPFIPKTPEEFDEVIDTQVQYHVEQKIKTLDQTWYQSKSPAWQVVAKYAEIAQDPSEIIPFIEGVKTIDSVNNLDETSIDDAEKIVRIRMQQRGESEDVIEENIEALKTTDKLISTAQKYKPIILQEERDYLTRMNQEAQQREHQERLFLASIQEKAIQAIESPFFGKEKLRQEEKAIIYDMIARPTEEKGFKIYSAIDRLFEEGDFEKLKKVALLLGKEDSFMNYISTKVADKTAASLERKIRVADAARSNSGNDQNASDPDKQVITRKRYPSTPKFGRG